MLEGIGVFGVSLLAFGWAVLPGDAALSADGYYHMTIVRLMAETGPVVDVSWLPLTVLGEHGPDHHWLWHLLLTPFAAIDDPFAGLKWAAVVSASVVPLGLYGAARWARIPGAAGVALLAVVSAQIVPGRLVMLRAQNLAIVLVALALVAMGRRRHLVLAAIAFAFMQSYHGAILLGPLVLAWTLIVAARERRLDPLPAAAVAGGVLLALVANPWFPDNVDYLLFHSVFKLRNEARLGVGLEWVSPPWAYLLREAWPTHVALLLGAGILLARRRLRELRADTLLCLCATAICLLLYKGAWRFAEYYGPIGVLTAGVLLRDAEIQAAPAWSRRALAVAASLLVLWQGTLGLGLIRRHSIVRPDRFAAVGAYLRDHAEPGEMVFNDAWPSFVYLVWHDSDRVYVNGLDPHYLLGADEARFAAWQRVGRARATDASDPALEVARVFQSRWVVVDRDAGKGLAARLLRSPHATLRVTEPAGWLFELTVPKTSN